MKHLVFVSSGLGNALLMTPFLKRLKSDGTELTGVFTSPFPCNELFPGTGLFDKKIVVGRSKWKSLFFVIKNLFRFDRAFLCVHAFSWQTFLISRLCARHITASYPIDVFTKRLPLNRWPRFVHYGVSLRPPVTGIHDVSQFVRLIDNNFRDEDITEEMLRLPLPPFPEKEKARLLEGFGLGDAGTFAVLQISAGNNTTPYKNWPVNYWIEWLRLAEHKYPGLTFALVGDPNETELAEAVMSAGLGNVISTVGKTMVSEVLRLIQSSNFYVGLDGGLMHLAVCLNKPTFSIWGGSDLNLYGYEEINPLKHRAVSLPLNCHPCNSWLAPNRSRVEDPDACPDFRCMYDLKPQYVFEEFVSYFDKLKGRLSFA